MSNRSLVELNHDLASRMKEPGFLEALHSYLANASDMDAERLSMYGARVFGVRHHSEPFHPMSEDEALEEMRKWSGEDRGDIEIAHSEADEILIRFLRANGYSRLADEYEDVEKWYA